MMKTESIIEAICKWFSYRQKYFWIVQYENIKNAMYRIASNTFNNDCQHKNICLHIIIQADVEKNYVYQYKKCSLIFTISYHCKVL